MRYTTHSPPRIRCAHRTCSFVQSKCPYVAVMRNYLFGPDNFFDTRVTRWTLTRAKTG